MTPKARRLSKPIGPNIQNIPVRTEIGRQIRHAFVDGPDIFTADYSQIERRVAEGMAARAYD